jgi:hypothetical protein
VLEGAEARHGVERPEGVGRDPPCVVQVDVEAVPPAGRGLCGGQGDADARAATASDEVQERTQPQPRSSTRRPGPIPICSAT